MKRSKAIGHLVEMAEVATKRLELRDTDFGWALKEMWAGGDLLGPADTLDVGSVVLRLDIPPEDLPWLSRHPTGEWIGDQLRLGKRPIQWCYRPTPGRRGIPTTGGSSASGPHGTAWTAR